MYGEVERSWAVMLNDEGDSGTLLCGNGKLAMSWSLARMAVKRQSLRMVLVVLSSDVVDLARMV